MGMTDAEREQLVEVALGLSDEQLAVVASVTPTDVLINVISERAKDMESRILSTVNAMKGSTNKRRGLSVIGI